MQITCVFLNLLWFQRAWYQTHTPRFSYSMVGTVQPQVFDCDFHENSVKYVHNGCPLLNEDKILFRVNRIDEHQMITQKKLKTINKTKFGFLFVWRFVSVSLGLNFDELCLAVDVWQIPWKTLWFEGFRVCFSDSKPIPIISAFWEKSNLFFSHFFKFFLCHNGDVFNWRADNTGWNGSNYTTQVKLTGLQGRSVNAACI